MAQWRELGESETSLISSGGMKGLRERFRMFALFERVKRNVVGLVTVSEEELQSEYRREFALSPVSFKDASDVIRDRLVDKEVDQRWSDWLRRQRACASIQFFGPPSNVRPEARPSRCD